MEEKEKKKERKLRRQKKIYYDVEKRYGSLKRRERRHEIVVFKEKPKLFGTHLEVLCIALDEVHEVVQVAVGRLRRVREVPLLHR